MSPKSAETAHLQGQWSEAVSLTGAGNLAWNQVLWRGKDIDMATCAKSFAES